MQTRYTAVLVCVTSKIIVFCLTLAGLKANRIWDKNYPKTSMSGTYNIPKMLKLIAAVSLLKAD